jgi:zinc transporter
MTSMLETAPLSASAARALPGFICAYRFGQDGSPTELSEWEVASDLAPDGEWLWLHFNLTDRRCLKWIERTGCVPRLAIDFLANVPSYQAIDHFEGVTTGSLIDMRREFDKESREIVRLHFLVGDRFLLTARTNPVQSAEVMRRQLAAGRRLERPSDLLLAFFVHFAERVETCLHELSNEIELIEDRVLDERLRDERRRAVVVRREAAKLHRQQRGLRRALAAAARDRVPFPADLTDLLERHAHIDHEFESIEARARLFHDEIDAKLAAETNRQLYRLSALTALFLPPALVAGLFGMNLEGMPWAGSPWGFLLATAAAVGSSVAVWFFLRYLDRE